jgi:hypothetical protein
VRRLLVLALVKSTTVNSKGVLVSCRVQSTLRVHVLSGLPKSLIMVRGP